MHSLEIRGGFCRILPGAVGEVTELRYQLGTEQERIAKIASNDPRGGVYTQKENGYYLEIVKMAFSPKLIVGTPSSQPDAGQLCVRLLKLLSRPVYLL